MQTEYESDANSTYCEDCGCRITIGRCKHGVMPPGTLLVIDKDSDFRHKGGTPSAGPTSPERETAQHTPNMDVWGRPRKEPQKAECRVPYSGGEWQIIGTDKITIESSNGDLIAVAHGRTMPQKQANARLIAAAPETARKLLKVTEQRDELLEACKTVASWLYSTMNESEQLEHELDAHDADQCVLCGLSAAIARAGKEAE